MTEDEDGVITEADLAEARKRWEDAEHEPSVPDIFSAPVYGDGFRGDVPIERKKEAKP